MMNLNLDILVKQRLGRVDDLNEVIEGENLMENNRLEAYGLENSCFRSSMNLLQISLGNQPYHSRRH